MPDMHYRSGHTHIPFQKFFLANTRYPIVPRVFSTYDRASRALRAYLQGEHEPDNTSKPHVGRIAGRWLGKVRVRSNTQRNPSDYTITKLRMEIF